MWPNKGPPFRAWHRSIAWRGQSSSYVTRVAHTHPSLLPIYLLFLFITDVPFARGLQPINQPLMHLHFDNFPFPFVKDYRLQIRSISQTHICISYFNHIHIFIPAFTNTRTYLLFLPLALLILFGGFDPQRKKNNNLRKAGLCTWRQVPTGLYAAPSYISDFILRCMKDRRQDQLVFLHSQQKFSHNSNIHSTFPLPFPLKKYQ